MAVVAPLSISRDSRDRMRGAAVAMAAVAFVVLARWGGGGGVLVAAAAAAAEEEEEVEEEGFATVRVAQGSLKGRRVATKGGGSYVSFQGVPYARPPVGQLRFQVAQPPESWEGVREALKEGPSCAQRDSLWARSYLEEEDCLYLNVYTPKLEAANDKYAVMLWIHGGGFLMGNGNSDLYGPDYLVNEDVILVTINYRLGAFGFMYLEDQSVPANVGLKDQVAAMRWVHENIEHFGGDPSRVTIFGESAGGAAVHYHIMSPMSKGLFHKAISQSGCALNPWALGRNTRHVALELAKELGYRDADHERLVPFLKSVPVREMVEAYAKVTAAQEFRGKKGRLGPVIETKIDDPNEAFLTADVRESMENRRYNPVPSILGFNSLEGILVLIFAGLLKSSTGIPNMNENIEALLDKYLEQEGNSKVEKKRILDTYFGNDSLSQAPLQRFINYLSDEWFFSGIDRTVKLFAASSQPTYYYNFAFYGQNNYYMKILNITTFPGATHLDELPYLFGMKFRNMDLEAKPKSPELLTQKRMVKLWTNFAKTSNPTPTLDETVDVEWPAYSSEDPAYLNIDTALSVGKNIHKERMDFWNSLE